MPDVGVQRGAVHRQVADLARRSGGAPVQLPAEDSGQAKAATEPDEDEVAGPGRRADGTFGHRGQVHVILDHHRPVPGVPERLERTFVPLGQIHRQAWVTGPRVHHAGTADHHRAQPGHVDARARTGPLDGPRACARRAPRTTR